MIVQGVGKCEEVVSSVENLHSILDVLMDRMFMGEMSLFQASVHSGR